MFARYRRRNYTGIAYQFSDWFQNQYVSAWIEYLTQTTLLNHDILQPAMPIRANMFQVIAHHNHQIIYAVIYRD
jgi:hypothetical protein